MNFYSEKLRNWLILCLSFLGLSVILINLFSRPENSFNELYPFFWPYAYIIVLALVLIVYVVFKKSDHNKIVSIFFIVFFNALSLLGMMWGALWELSVLGMPHVPNDYNPYGRYYFFSSIFFYLIFFRLNKEFVGLFSKILYWLYVASLSFVLICIFIFS